MPSRSWRARARRGAGRPAWLPIAAGAGTRGSSSRSRSSDRWRRRYRRPDAPGRRGAQPGRGSAPAPSASTHACATVDDLEARRRRRPTAARDHARVNPRRAASASRRSSCGTERTSPPSPTSPTATVSARPRPCVERALATASASARSTPGLGDAHPAGDARVDVGAGERRRRRAARAPRAACARRPASMPGGRPPRHRRAVGTTSACTSTSSGRAPFEHRGDRRARRAGATVDEEQRRRVGHVDEPVARSSRTARARAWRRSGASARAAGAASGRGRRRTRARCRRRARARAARRACPPW